MLLPCCKRTELGPSDVEGERGEDFSAEGEGCWGESAVGGPEATESATVLPSVTQWISCEGTSSNDAGVGKPSAESSSLP